MMFKSEKKMRAVLAVLAVVFGASAPVSSFAQDAAAQAL
ncbi:invasion associated locus B family protein, partial [Rhizobium ruizarguesonis]